MEAYPFGKRRGMGLWFCDFAVCPAMFRSKPSGGCFPWHCRKFFRVFFLYDPRLGASLPFFRAANARISRPKGVDNGVRPIYNGGRKVNIRNRFRFAGRSPASKGGPGDGLVSRYRRFFAFRAACQGKAIGNQVRILSGPAAVKGSSRQGMGAFHPLAHRQGRGSGTMN